MEIGIQALGRLDLAMDLSGVRPESWFGLSYSSFVPHCDLI